MTQRDTAATLAWYEKHTTTGALGFNPNGRCLQICRTARNLPGGWASAVVASRATPTQHRVRDLSKIVPGMVMYFDDTRDGNPYGHIVTVVHANRARSLSDITVWTNSVQSGRVVKVRADYFPRYWGDPFVFAATWLNGQALILPKQQPAPAPSSKKVVDLSRLVSASKSDPPGPQGQRTYPAGVKLVEQSLVKEGLLAAKYASDGSYGSTTVTAYRKWQQRLGYSGKDADGIPGMSSLKSLGNKHGFTVKQ